MSLSSSHGRLLAVLPLCLTACLLGWAGQASAGQANNHSPGLRQSTPPNHPSTQQQEGGEFVPIQLYSQVRRSSAEVHLPREAASAEEASVEEEELRAAAPRLREIFRDKTIHEVYEEKGHDQLGYDHGDYEVYGEKSEEVKEEKDSHYRKSKPKFTDSDEKPLQQEESRRVNQVEKTEGRKKVKGKVLKGDKKMELSDRIDGGEVFGEVEPRVMSRGSSKVVFPGEASRRSYSPASLVSPIVVIPELAWGTSSSSSVSPLILHKTASLEPTSYLYETSPTTFTASSPIQLASTINAYASLINQNFPTPIGDVKEDLPLLRPDRNTPSQIPPVKNQPSSTAATKYSTNSPAILSTYPPAVHTTRPRGRRRGHLRRPVQNPEPTEKVLINPYPKKNKIYRNVTRVSSKYSPEDSGNSDWTPTFGTQNIRHPTKPIDSSEGKHEYSPRPIIVSEPAPTRIIVTLTPDPSDNPLTITSDGLKDPPPTKDPTANAKYVEQLTIAQFSTPVNVNLQQSHLTSQNERLSELAKQLNSPSIEQKRRRRRALKHIKEKYPYYESPKSISKYSPLKYASNLDDIPKKTYGGMEFYKSKEKIKCDGPFPPENITPEDKESDEDQESKEEDPQRIKGVGDAIKCYKTKFFGNDPLDNPFFKEKEINDDGGIYKDVNVKTPPYSDNASNRKIMFILNPDFLPHYSESDSDKRSYSSRHSGESIELSEDASIRTKGPRFSQYSSGEDSAYESNEEKRHVHDGKLKHKDCDHHSKTKEKTQYYMQPVALYSIISTNSIPPHHAPLLIPKPTPKYVSPRVKKENLKKTSADIPKLIPFPERKIIVTKREATEDFWSSLNPLKWVWPTLFDGRRNEPRYRRSSDFETVESTSMSFPEDNSNSETKTTRSPMSLAEFKLKFNIPENKFSPKKVSARLSGGFLNRNSNVALTVDDLQKPTEALTSSTVPTSTAKPKVIFPRANIPRRKTVPSRKKSNVTEGILGSSTTTSSTTLAPSTTTRMYKPKKILNKNGPINVFSILKETSSTAPLMSTVMLLAEDELEMKRQATEATKSADPDPKEEEPQPLLGSPKVTEMEEKNGTLTYSVDPASGLGSWSQPQQRKWKPKRKRLNRPSVYSYGNVTFKKPGEFRLRQRDLPGRKKQMQTKLPVEEKNKKKLQVIEVKATSPRLSKPPPKYILEPDKRKYYIARV